MPKAQEVAGGIGAMDVSAGDAESALEFLEARTVPADQQIDLLPNVVARLSSAGMATMCEHPAEMREKREMAVEIAPRIRRGEPRCRERAERATHRLEPGEHRRE
jgi:hypothetical protein